MKYSITFTCTKEGPPIVRHVAIKMPITSFVTIEVEAPEKTPAQDVRALAEAQLPLDAGNVIYWEWHEAYWADPNFVPREYIPGKGWDA